MTLDILTLRHSTVSGYQKVRKLKINNIEFG